MQLASSVAQIWTIRSPWLRAGSNRSLGNDGIRVSWAADRHSPNRSSNSDAPNPNVTVRSDGPTPAPRMPLSGGG